MNEHEVRLFYGPLARLTMAKDIKVGTMIVMNIGPGKKNPTCTPVVSVRTIDNVVSFRCQNLFDYHMDPYATIITNSKTEEA